MTKEGLKTSMDDVKEKAGEDKAEENNSGNEIENETGAPEAEKAKDTAGGDEISDGGAEDSAAPDEEESDGSGDGESSQEDDAPPNDAGGRKIKDDISGKSPVDGSTSETKSSGFFKKKKKDKKDEKIEELEDKVRRQLAEFDNFRKRTEKEKSHMYEAGARDVIEKILPVVDNFERGLAAVPEEEKGNPVIEGMDKTYRQLMETLTALGVEVIEAEGKEFDPNLHNAVMHVEDESLGENMVVQEFQKGYKYRDTVVRHSMVKVAN